jgi:hypothetical protein
MNKPTFKTIKQVQFFKDKDCTIKYGDIKHDLRVFPNRKGQVINTLGGTFGMGYKSNKNNINKVVSCVTTDTDPSNEYYYSIIVEGVVCYFKFNINLYIMDSIIDNVIYETLIPIEKKSK